MKITVESVFNIQYSRTAFQVFGDVYLNGELKAWIGFMSKTELKAGPGENTIEIFFEKAVNERIKIKFYATEDVHIFVRSVRVADTLIYNSVLETLAVGEDLKIIEERVFEE